MGRGGGGAETGVARPEIGPRRRPCAAEVGPGRERAAASPRRRSTSASRSSSRSTTGTSRTTRTSGRSRTSTSSTRRARTCSSAATTNNATGAASRRSEGLVRTRCRIPGNFFAEGGVFVTAAVVSLRADRRSCPRERRGSVPRHGPERGRRRARRMGGRLPRRRAPDARVGRHRGARTMKVAILAGGLGTRLSEETDVRPKPMVEIGGQPILWHIMKHYEPFGFAEFVVALGYKGEVVKRYFLDYNALSGSINVSLRGRQGHAARRRPRALDRQPGRHRATTTNTGGRLKRLRSVAARRDLHAHLRRRRLRRRPGRAARVPPRHGKLATITAVRPPSRFGEMVFDGDGRRCASPRSRRWARAGSTAASWSWSPQVLDLIEGDDTEPRRATSWSDLPTSGSWSRTGTSRSGSAWTRSATSATCAACGTPGKPPWVTWA